jgi:GTP cyclohydrolase III
MSIRLFEIDIPVQVREMERLHHEEEAVNHQSRLTVRIVMGPNATPKDAVEELARNLESVCNTNDIGDCE